LVLHGFILVPMIAVETFDSMVIVWAYHLHLKRDISPRRHLNHIPLQLHHIYLLALIDFMRLDLQLQLRTRSVHYDVFVLEVV
jgi:hypothetical protein